jgi:hypothetical protein
VGGTLKPVAAEPEILMFESVTGRWREDEPRRKKRMIIRAWLATALAWFVCLIIFLENHWK